MTATRPVVRPPAPAGRPAARRERPALRVVPDRRRHTGAIVTAALVLVFGVLLGTAALNTMLVSGQRELDRMEREIAEGRRQNQALHLQQAELESPARIVEAARRDGMIIPPEVTWITPSPDGGSDAATTPRAGAPDDGTDIDDPGPDGGTDLRADGGEGPP